MKKLRILFSLLLLTVLLAGLGGQAFAESSYSVRLYGGNSDVGVLKNSHDTTVAYKGTAYGDFSVEWVDVKDDRYFVKGFREAGKDNEKGSAVYVTGYSNVLHDMDFVVAYGMKGSAVEYTVNFVDGSGAKLVDSRTLYANVGDKPVVSYIYIEGYQPQAYALTKTLANNPADNVFTFTYTEVQATTTVIGGGGGAVVVPVGGNAGANPAQHAAPAQPAAPVQPETIIDLDVPLAAPDDATTEPGPEGPEQTGEPEPTAEPEPGPEKPKDAKLASWIPYVLGIGGVALLGAFLAALNRRKKKGEALTPADMEDALKEAKKEVNEAKNKK